MTVLLDGKLPLGTTKGTALISSPQLAEAVPVAFEIKTRRSKLFIVGVIAFGLITGFAVRTFAQQQIDSYTAHKKARETISALRKELQKRQDATFRSEIENAISSIEQAAGESDKEKLATAITTANTTLTDALSSLKTRRGAAQALLVTLNHLIVETKSLSEFAGLMDVKNNLDDIQQAIEMENIDGSQTLIDKLIDDLRPKFENAISDWRPKIELFLDELKNLFPFLATAAMEDSLKQKSDELFANIKALKLTETSAIEDLTSIINELGKTQREIREFLTSLRLAVFNTVNTLKFQFDITAAKNKPEINKFFEELRIFYEKTADWMVSPSEKFGQVQNDVNDLKTPWQTTLASLVDADKNLKKEVEETLDNKNYRESVSKIIKFLSRPADSLLGASNRSASSDVAATAEVDFLRKTPATSEAGVNFTHFTVIKSEEETAPFFEAFQGDSPGGYIAANLIRFLVASAGIIAVGYLLFADKFTGTFSDLMGIFVWAFGIDVSINSFITLSGRLKS